jgi:hypothetical protein
VTELRDDLTKGRLSQLNNGGYAKYKGFTLMLGKHLGHGWYSFLISYTNQISNGNSFLFLDMSQHQGILDPQYKGDAQPADLYGKTVYDKPYDFKAYAAFKLPWGFLVSGIFNATDGTPYTTYSYDPPFYEHPHFVSAYQSLRFPKTKNLDLRVEKDFRIKGKFNIKFKLDVFNAFNWESVYEVLAEVESRLRHAVQHRPDPENSARIPIRLLSHCSEVFFGPEGIPLRPLFISLAAAEAGIAE